MILLRKQMQTVFAHFDSKSSTQKPEVISSTYQNKVKVREHTASSVEKCV